VESELLVGDWRNPGGDPSLPLLAVALAITVKSTDRGERQCYDERDRETYSLVRFFDI